MDAWRRLARTHLKQCPCAQCPRPPGEPPRAARPALRRRRSRVRALPSRVLDHAVRRELVRLALQHAFDELQANHRRRRRWHLCDSFGNAGTYAWPARDIRCTTSNSRCTTKCSATCSTWPPQASLGQPQASLGPARPCSQHRLEAMGHDLLPNPWESATGEHTISPTEVLRSARQSRAARPVGHTESIDDPVCG